MCFPQYVKGFNSNEIVIRSTANMKKKHYGQMGNLPWYVELENEVNGLGGTTPTEACYGRMVGRTALATRNIWVAKFCALPGGKCCAHGWAHSTCNEVEHKNALRKKRKMRRRTYTARISLPPRQGRREQSHYLREGNVRYAVRIQPRDVRLDFGWRL